MPETTNPILIRHLAPKNFLSFGPDNAGIELQSLNLFIGPNGSGKSNLIEMVSLLRAAALDLREVMRIGGGFQQWIWKGAPDAAASLTVEVNNRASMRSNPIQLLHTLALRTDGQSFAVADERIENTKPYPGNETAACFYSLDGGNALVTAAEHNQLLIARQKVDVTSSVLAQLKGPAHYPEITYLADIYSRIRIYREWTFGRRSIFRQPQPADMRSDRLEEDFSNLGLFLNRLKTRFPVAKKAILAGLTDLYDGVTDFDVSIEGGTVQVFFTEGDFVIPATRLSDGTLRYLCLLAILCDPEPPPLICIEEPELGLHPDILPKVADLLKAAAERTQIIVTTHSDILVDTMTETPECVVVCAKAQGQTTMERLNPDGLAQWLTKYRLGQLWTKGEIGGIRW